MQSTVHVGRHAYKLLTENRPQEAFRALAGHGGLVLQREALLLLLEECNKRAHLIASKWAFCLLVTSGLDATPYFGDHAIRMFASCGNLQGATQVFSKLSIRSAYTWNALISAFVKLGEAARALQFFNGWQMYGIEPNQFVLSCLLKACASVGALKECKMIHHYLVYTGVRSDVTLGNILISTYSSCKNLDEAWKVFIDSPNRDLVSWSTMLGAYINNGCSIAALELYDKMKEDGIKADKVVFLYILKACSDMKFLVFGQILHYEIIKCGFETDSAVRSTILDMYAKCGSTREACKVFQAVPQPNVVSWSAMIFGLTEHGDEKIALKLYMEMQQVDIELDKVGFLSVLKACCGLQEIGVGRLVHGQIVEAELEEEVVVGSSLIDMYATSGSIEDARCVFDRLSNRDVVAWATIIMGYAKTYKAPTALTLFGRLEQEQFQPSIPAFLGVLKACSSMGDREQGMLLHDKIIRNALEHDDAIGSSLVDMYSKCGDVEGSQKVFNKLPKLNEVSHGAMLAGYAEHGEGLLALSILDKMECAGFELDNITFLYALKACSCIGSIADGRHVHHKIIKSGLETDLIIGNGLVEMYMKCWRLNEGSKVFDILPSRDVVSWGILISGYAELTDGALVGYYLREMQKSGLEPEEGVFACLLNACSHSSTIDTGCFYYNVMTEKYGISPTIEHYCSMIGLLGRTGCCIEAEDLVITMPTAPNIIIRTAWLNSCRQYNIGFIEQQSSDQFAYFGDGDDFLEQRVCAILD